MHMEKTLDPLSNASFQGFDNSIANTLWDDNIYFQYFATLAQNMFEWENLPETMNEEFLEQTLFLDGRAVMVKDPILGYVNLKYSEVGKPNIYNLPNKVTAFSNDFSKTYDKEDFVICRNNINYIPTALYVDHFTKIITNIEQTMQVNLQAQKTPVTFTASKEQAQAMQSLYQKYVGNQPYLFVKKDGKDLVNVDVLKTDAPFLADKLNSLKNDYKGEFLSFIGINNVNDEKRERMITDEANANNQFISMNFKSFYEARLRFCEEANKKWNLTLNVRPKVGSQILEDDNTESEVPDENGNVYDQLGSDS